MASGPGSQSSSPSPFGPGVSTNGPPYAPQPPIHAGPFASWGSRVGAFLIDTLIITIPCMVLGGFIGAVAGATRGGREHATDAFLMLALVLGVLLWLVAYLFYAPVLMARSGRHNGQTWGKEMMGIRAVRDNGQPWTFSSAAIREALVKELALTVLATIVPVLPWLLNFLWPVFDEQNRALHDIVVSSHVVRVVD